MSFHPTSPRHSSFFLLLAIALLGALGAAVPETAPPPQPNVPIPIELLFRAPYLAQVRLSPDGKSIAGLNHQPDAPTNFVMLTMGQPGAMTLKGSEASDPYKFSWLNDEALLVHSINDKIYAGGLRAINRDDFSRQILLGSANIDIVGRPTARPRNVILWDDRRELEEVFGKSFQLVERSLDDYSFKYGKAVSQRPYRATYPEPDDKDGTVLGYGSDVAGELALCYRYVEGTTKALLYDAVTKKWEPLKLDSRSTTILAVEADHRHLWISEYNATTGFQVRRFSPATRVREPAVVTDPLFNPGEGSVHFSLLENALVGISYQQRRLKNVWFNARYSGLQAAVDQLLPQTDNQLVDSDTKERYFLYYCASDQKPGVYYLLDSEEGTLKVFAQAYPWLSGRTFATTRAIKFKSRDGLELEGYLTVPAEASPKNKVPLIVLCHGGPTSRDEWGFDPEVQFLASRGYAVLQPNYRGSSGYKPEISTNWDYDYRRMHDDVTDATNTFRQLDIIDRTRVAIMGASFGGYLAVAGAAFERDLYRCAITNSGVFDWKRLTKTAKWEGRPGEYEMLKDHLTQPGKDRAYFESISPISSAKNIKIPVFIAHGKEDNVVNLEQSTKLASILRGRKTPVETFFPKDELHGFRSFKNQIEYYQRIQAFLAKNLR